MDPVTIAAIAASLSTTISSVVGSVRLAKDSQERQEKHDREMALLGQQIEDEQFSKQNIDYNSWSTGRSHMIAAGFNPALVYGGMSPETGYQSSGGASASNVMKTPDLSALNSLAPSELGNLRVAQLNSEALRERSSAEADYFRQRSAESAVDMLEKSRLHHFNKSLEKTIIDQATANLLKTQQEERYFSALTGKANSETVRLNMLAPAEYEEIMSRIGVNSVTTSKLLKETEAVQAMIEREPFVRNQLKAEARQLNAAADLAIQNKKLSEAQKNSLEEELRSSIISRTARECGLTGRRPGKTSKGMPGQIGTFDHNEIAFCLTLQKYGFSQEEALTAAYYFSFGNLNDLSSEWINAGSRVLSGLGAGLGAGASSRAVGLGGKTSPSAPTGNRGRR